MTALTSNKGLFWAAVLAGAALWVVFGLLGTEPWDVPYGWLVLALLGFGFGFLGQGNPVLWPLGIFLGEVLFGVGSLLKSLFAYGGGGANLFFPLGLIFLVPFTAAALLGSLLGFGLRKMLSKAPRSDA